MNTIITNFKAAFEVLKKKPILLWGLTLMSNLLVILATLFGYIPLIIFPITVTLEASLSMLLLKGLRGQEVNSSDLFTGFSDFKRVAGGMLWMNLWIFIWGLIPVCGFVFAIIKTYSYRFTPYILMTRPDVKATDAIKESMKMTKGLRGKMFWADMLPVIAFMIGLIILEVFAGIPYIGVLFVVVILIYVLLFDAFISIFEGLVSAKFYDDAVNGDAPVVTE